MRRLAITLALLALAGCGDEGAADEPPGNTPPATRACTEIGCNDAAEVRFAGLPRGRLWIRMCADERCEHCPPVCRSVPGATRLHGPGPLLGDAATEVVRPDQVTVERRHE